MLAFCLGLFSIAILTSMTAMDFSSSLMALCLVYQSWRWRQQNESRAFWNFTGFDWLFVVWILVVGLGFAINSGSDSNWLMRLVEFKWILLLYVFITVFIEVSPKEKIVPWANAVLIICAVYAIAVFFIGENPFFPDREVLNMAGGVRTGGFLGNPMMFAHSYGQVLPFVFAVFLYQWRWKLSQRWWTLLTTTLMALALLLSFTRGVWIAAAVSLIIIGFLFRFSFGFIISVILSAVIYFLTTAWEGFKERLFYVLDNPQGYDIERLYIWKANIEIWRDYPILGVGYGENSKYLPDYLVKVAAPFEGFQAHAHNQYIHMLAGTGVVGLLCYVFILLFFLILSFKVWRRVSDRDHWYKSLILGSIGAQIVFIIGGLTECNFEHSKVRFVLMTSWAIAVWLAYETRVLKQRI